MTSAAALCVVVGLSLAGCGGRDGFAYNGPLSDPNRNSGRICLPSPNDTRVTWTIEVLQPTETVTILSIDPVGLRDATLIETRILEFRDIGGYGTTNGYPPDPDLLAEQGGDWADSMPAAGATLLAGHSYDIMVGLEVQKTGLILDHLLVKYTAGGKRYQLNTTFQFFVSLSDSCDGVMPD